MTLTAHNNVTLSSFMYGTAWKEGATTHLVQLAVASGFTAIDTANQIIHYREDLVGEALLALDKKGVKRDTLFLQTKFTPVNGQDHRTPYDAWAISPPRSSNHLPARSPTSIPTKWTRMYCTVRIPDRDWENRTGKSGRPWKSSINPGRLK